MACTQNSCPTGYSCKSTGYNQSACYKIGSTEPTIIPKNLDFKKPFLYEDYQGLIVPENQDFKKPFLYEDYQGGGSTPSPTTTPTATSTNNPRGGTHNPTADKTFNIFGHTINIPQNMVIPAMLGGLLAIIVIIKAIL